MQTDADQTPRSAASDVGLHCLPMSFIWDASHKLVNIAISSENVHLTTFAVFRSFFLDDKQSKPAKSAV